MSDIPYLHLRPAPGHAHERTRRRVQARAQAQSHARGRGRRRGRGRGRVHTPGLQVRMSSPHTRSLRAAALRAALHALGPLAAFAPPRRQPGHRPPLPALPPLSLLVKPAGAAERNALRSAACPRETRAKFAGRHRASLVRGAVHQAAAGHARKPHRGEAEGRWGGCRRGSEEGRRRSEGDSLRGEAG